MDSIQDYYDLVKRYKKFDQLAEQIVGVLREGIKLVSAAFVMLFL